MERALSQNERIRRAEQVYARRQNTRERTRHATVNISEPKNFTLIKRVILQSIICVLIYFIFYLINTTSYSFSDITINKTNEILSNDYDFESVYNNIKDNINAYISSLKDSVENNINVEEANSQGELNTVEQFVEGEEKTKDEKIENGGEGASIEQEEQSNIGSMNDDEEVSTEELNQIEISETDRIKKSYSFIVPVNRKNFIRIRRKRANVKYCFKIS